MCVCLGVPRQIVTSRSELGTGRTSPDYFRTLRIPLLKGRVFTTRDGAGAPGVTIINETMARQLFPGEDPLGARLQAMSSAT